MTRVISGRSVLAGLGVAIVGYVLVVAFGDVHDVQAASDSESFGVAAAAAGNRVRLALLFDLAVFVPGYLLTVGLWSKWRMQLQNDRAAASTGPSGSALTSRLYRFSPFAIAAAAAADLLENCFVYIGLGVVDLSDAAAATMVAPTSALIALLRTATAVKWLAVALALLSLVVAGANELLARRRDR